MKIALVTDFLTKFGGAQRVLLALHEMYPEAPVYCLAYDEKGTKGEFKKCTIIESSLGNLPSFLKKRTKFFLASFPKRIEEFDFSGFDIVISVSDSYSHGIITKPTTFHLCYCNTPMRYVWDWYNEYLAENNLTRGLKSLYVRNVLHKIRIWDRVAAHRVDKWIANSENVANRISKYYRVDSKVIYPPARIDKIKPAKEPALDYYLVLSRLEPYKKIKLAVEACTKLNKKLIVIGEGSELPALKKTAGKNVSFLGWQSDEQVYKHLGEAKALIFPGEEDFGLTPVESFAAGRPVIAYKKGGTLETVTEGKTGVFFEEPTVASLSDAITRFEKNTTISSEECLKMAQNFTTEIFMLKMRETIDQGYKEYLEKFQK